jgi:hypothetical protein
LRLDKIHKAGGWRLEAGGWRLEAGGLRLDKIHKAGGWRLEVFGLEGHDRVMINARILTFDLNRCGAEVLYLYNNKREKEY